MVWTPFTVAAPEGVDLPDDTVTYGPSIPREDTLKLLGPLDGKRILDLGCGAGRNAVALARAGARTIAVDDSPEQLAAARAAAEDVEDVRMELHQSSLAELAFLRADTIDAVLSVYALQRVADVGRVFRQIHRVLKTERHLVFSVPHPTFCLLDPRAEDPARIRRSMFEEAPWPSGDGRRNVHTRSVSTLFTELGRAGFRVDTLLEPAATTRGGDDWSPVLDKVPSTLIVRARKEGN